MFTGLVECTGVLRARSEREGGVRLGFDAPLEGLVIGESVSVSGACLTVVQAPPGGFDADVTVETLARTTLGRLEPGRLVNLERAVRAGDRLGGHLVSGHVDGIAEVLRTERAGEALEVHVGTERSLLRYVATKGSVALDGVSLTVNSVTSDSFSIMLIPHTLAVTTLQNLAPGRLLNLEVDLVARYVARWLEGAP
ncbi:MAG TPA: riboflavin synthase [Polyangiaceae bacterium]